LASPLTTLNIEEESKSQQAQQQGS